MILFLMQVRFFYMPIRWDISAKLKICVSLILSCMCWMGLQPRLRSFMQRAGNRKAVFAVVGMARLNIYNLLR